jgi:DNA-binding Lrp family transcriptional regulator
MAHIMDEIKLDLKDKKLLYELDLDSRQSFNELGKRIGLSKDAVIYRIERMKKEGIINGFHTVIDLYKIGGIFFRLYIKFQNTTPRKEQEIIDFILKQKRVVWAVSMEGEYDFGLGFFAKTTEDMNKFWKELIKKYVNYIEKRWLTIWTKVSYFARAYLLDKKQNDKELAFISGLAKQDVDEKDLRILELLSKDARIPIIDIANKLKSTPKTIIKRIADLEEREIILGYRTFFAMEKLGYRYFKLHINLHNVTDEKERNFREFIKIHPNIIYDNEVLGGGDIELDVQLKSLDELRDFIEEIKIKFS